MFEGYFKDTGTVDLRKEDGLKRMDTKLRVDRKELPITKKVWNPQPRDGTKNGGKIVINQ